MKDGTRKIAGLTLVETAIALSILGLMLAGILSLYDQAERQQQPRVTEMRMNRIVSALSTYVETHGRLPCPANPARADAVFGWEWNVSPDPPDVNAGGAPIGECRNNNNRRGIVPFQTLNLPHETILDGWGRYFTYGVSPIFTFDNDANAPNPVHVPDDQNDRVHEQCRTRAWVDFLDNVNAVKARFCCTVDPDDNTISNADINPNRDIVIREHDTGNTISPVRDSVAAFPGRWNGLNEEYDDVYGRALFSSQSVIAPAFVLVSHGEDGRGAFLGNDTANRYNIDNSFTRERENWDNDQTYNIGTPNLGNANAQYFDDMVIWMTQHGIMAANGTSSCQFP